MRVFSCSDHAGRYVGAASVIVAEDELAARVLLDAELASRKLQTSAQWPYTLVEVSLSEPKVTVLQDGDY